MSVFRWSAVAMRAGRLGALIAAVAVVAPAPLALAQQSCEDPQAQCGAIIEQSCLTRVGAGVLAVEEASSADECQSQLRQYRDCLAEAVAACPQVRQTPRPDDGPSLEALAERLGRLGGLIETPETPVEFYNNALVYAQRGDALSSRRMYEKAIVAGVESVDVHQRYSQLLKAQEGLIGAREIYGDLVRRAPDNKGAQLANALLQPANRREEALRALVAGDDPFAPAFYEIANLFSRDRLGDQSLEDQRAEKAALDAFAAADEAGRVYRWFLQKETAEIWRESVRRRLAGYQNRALDIDPVSLTATASNDSWIVTLILVEAAREIRYSVDGGPLKDTGKLAHIDQRTGQPMPGQFMTLPLGTETASIEVWYDDVRNVERGPFTLSFDAMESFSANAKNVLETLTTQWVLSRDFDGRQLIYFTHLMSQGCGLAEIAYGLDRDTPDRTWPLSPCDAKNPYAFAEDAEIYLETEGSVGRMVIQLTYADGETTAARQFEFD